MRTQMQMQMPLPTPAWRERLKHREPETTRRRYPRAYLRQLQRASGVQKRLMQVQQQASQEGAVAAQPS